MANVFSVDVEDYFQVEAFSSIVSHNDWKTYPSRVVANTQRILEMLARHNVRGTFFVLGWVARHHPALVREIASQGHEIASHVGLPDRPSDRQAYQTQTV